MAVRSLQQSTGSGSPGNPIDDEPLLASSRIMIAPSNNLRPQYFYKPPLLLNSF